MFSETTGLMSCSRVFVSMATEQLPWKINHPSTSSVGTENPSLVEISPV